MNRSTGLTRLQKVTEEKLRDARSLRKKMTPAETLMWELLRNRRCGGYKFRRQQVVEGFITDFYCEAARLAVEIDGGVHSEEKQKETDERRKEVFLSRGIKTIRFANEDVSLNIDGVLQEIAQECRLRIRSES